MIPRARLDDLDEAVIRQLVDDEVRESRTLAFKEQLDLSRDGRYALAEDDPATVLVPLLDVLRNAVGIEHTQTNVAEDGA
jgi:hypothetical protein